MMEVDICPPGVSNTWKAYLVCVVRPAPTENPCEGVQEWVLRLAVGKTGIPESWNLCRQQSPSTAEEASRAESCAGFFELIRFPGPDCHSAHGIFAAAREESVAEMHQRARTPSFQVIFLSLRVSRP